jgi:hypothetical protein
MRFNSLGNVSKPEKWIHADDMSHFLVSHKKISLNVNHDYDRSYEIPEKIRCAEPILYNVANLIVNYNALESISVASDLIKEAAPILLGIGIDSNTDQVEATKQIQNNTIAINEARKVILDNMNNLNVQTIMEHLKQIQLIPHSTEGGINSIQQINLNQGESNLSEKLNDIKRTIALAVGIPEHYLASTPLVMDKNDSISTNSRYSRMLSGIQQSLARGIVEFIHKHLRYRFSKRDNDGIMYLQHELDRSNIDVRFKSITNVDNRLEKEQMLLTANTLAQIIGVLDTITGSPNINLVADTDKTLEFLKDELQQHPKLRDILKKGALDENQIGMGNIGQEDDNVDLEDETDIDDDSVEDAENDTNVKDSQDVDIKDIFK